jgi:hypothetical protein
MEAKMERIQVQLEEEQVEWLRAQSKIRGVSVAQLIREGVSFLQAGKDQHFEQRKRRSLAAIGRFASNATDVSERHDDYLAEAYRNGD